MVKMDYLYKEECSKIIGAAIEVQRELNTGYHESVYQEALAVEFSLRDIPFEREKQLPIIYKGHILNKYYIADFVCYDNIIVELKAQEKLTIENQLQVLNYLKITQKKLGLLINFGESPLKFKRLIL